MAFKIPKSIRNIFFLALGLGLMYWAFRNQDIPQLWSRLVAADMSWIVLSIIIAVVALIARGIRWRILFLGMGHKPSLRNVVLALFAGYFTNLIFPRLGEITRCAYLKTTDEIPVDESLGTVIVDRVLDLIVLVLVLLITLLIEFNTIYTYVAEVVADSPYRQYLNWKLFVVLALFGLGSLYFIYRFISRSSTYQHPLLEKIRSLIIGVRKGLLSIRYLQQKPLFFITTIVIWVGYYFMSYVIVFSIPETSGLSYGAGLSVLAMGAIAMVAPVQGGIGAYHALVSGCLIYYGIALEDGLVYATLLHTSQVFFYVFFGGISVLISIFVFQKKKKTSP